MGTTALTSVGPITIMVPVTFSISVPWMPSVSVVVVLVRIVVTAIRMSPVLVTTTILSVSVITSSLLVLAQVWMNYGTLKVGR